MDNPCPNFSGVASKIRDEFKGEHPSCCGAYLSGSGGHRVHEGPCSTKATWWHPDDCYAYCDNHILERDKLVYKKLWAENKPFRELLIAAYSGNP